MTKEVKANAKIIDDAKLKESINSHEDVEKLQEFLNKVFFEGAPPVNG